MGAATAGGRRPGTHRRRHIGGGNGNGNAEEEKEYSSTDYDAEFDFETTIMKVMVKEVRVKQNMPTKIIVVVRQEVLVLEQVLKDARTEATLLDARTRTSQRRKNAALSSPTGNNNRAAMMSEQEGFIRGLKDVSSKIAPIVERQAHIQAH